MTLFSPEELDAIDQIWRAIPPDHVWTGWSADGDAPSQVTLYRTQSHWRRFPLKKTPHGFSLYDDQAREIASGTALKDLPAAVESIPGLPD